MRGSVRSDDNDVIIHVNRRGQMTIPKEIRERWRADEGISLSATLRSDGTLELHPVAIVPREQAWFWTERWQAMEREAQEDIAAGRIRRFDSAEDLFNDLDEAESD